MNEVSKDTSGLFSLLQDITEIAQFTDNINDAVRATLQKLCAYTCWPIGHSYSVSSQQSEPIAKSSGIWFLDNSFKPSEIKEFVELSEQTEFKYGVGLIGKILQSKESASIADVSHKEGFLQRQRLDRTM